jgi:aminoglycoside phosphotransferase (APT) family kinase protein
VAAAAPGEEVVGVRGLREGGAPWLVCLAGGSSFVLRTGGTGASSALATEVAALQLAAGSGVPVPRLIAADLDGVVTPGILAVVSSVVPGSSRVSGPPSPARFLALGAAAAAIHRVPAPPPSAALPVRTRPIGNVDFAALRRAAPPHPLLNAAVLRLDRMPAPQTAPVFVHGDLWQGNTLWEEDRLTGVVDWDMAGIGPLGVDLGSLRCDAAMTVGPDAAEAVLAGYEEAAGFSVPGVAYWDVVAALCTPPTIDWFVDAMHDQGRLDLDRATLLSRRDAFLAAALDRL